MLKLVSITLLVALCVAPAFSEQVPQPKSDLTCEICDLVLTAAGTLLSNNETDDKIIAFIEKNLCGNLGGLNGTCVQFMETEGKQILYELAHGIDPSVICHRIGLCNARSLFPIQQAASLNCTLCKLVMTQVQNMLKNNQSETEILQFIEQHICNITGALSELCKTVIDSYGPQILKLLANEVDPEKVCELIQMCSKNSTVTFNFEIPKKANPIGNTIECELCELVLNAAKTLLAKNQTEDEVISFIEKELCGRLGPLNGTCVNFIETEGRSIINQLINGANVSQVCATIGLCTSKIAKVEPKSVPKANPIECELCQLVLNAARTLLAKNETEDEVISFIEKQLCGRLGPLNGTCVNFMETEGKAILSDLVNGVNSSVICAKFNLCATRIQLPTIQPKNEVYCTVCQYVIQFLDLELQNNKTESAIVSALDQVCKLTPSSLRTQCDNIVDTYGVYLVQLLIEFADPLKVCQAIKLCN